ncbi:MAG: mechanosensitive ion channel [Chlorobi bacterium]|nr:mechanosensitive ion channel [Chlorobiota bacterium]
MDITNTIGSQYFGRLILFAVLILIFFRLLKFGLSVVFKSKKNSRLTQTYFPLVELISWVIFLVLYLFLFFSIRSAFAYVLVGVVFFLLYFVMQFGVKDMIAGVFFKSRNKFRIGDVLEFENQKGIVKNLGHSSIEIETGDGQTQFIPYTKIIFSITKKSETTGQSSGYSFLLETTSGKDILEITNDIKTAIISLPWSSVQRMPLINLKEQTDKTSIFEITVYPVDSTFSGKIEKYVVGKFGAGTA